MAIITAPEQFGFAIEALAPAGTYVATCLDIEDQFGVDRPKFENPQETEELDVTRFLFGFRGPDGQIYKVQSFEFRISGSPKSNLIKFLTSWLGQAPKYGWDYCELKGQGAMITVAHKQSRDIQDQTPQGERIDASLTKTLKDQQHALRVEREIHKLLQRDGTPTKEPIRFNEDA